jgi:hypothetical protein
MYVPRPAQVGYVLFVDESGDDGYSKVWPIDQDGASEWLILAGLLVKIDKHLGPVEWVREFRRGIKGAQRPDLHFYSLSDVKRLEACKFIATKPVRCFVVISNKRNMRGYRNPRAERWETRNPLYNWMLRLLLEKASRYCAWRSMADYGEMRGMRVEIAARGGVSVARIRVYLYKLRNQNQMGRLWVSRDDISWACIDEKQVHVIPAHKRAGIQLADTVASAFGQAVDVRDGGLVDTRYAEAILKVMPQSGGIRAETSVKLMPGLPLIQKAGLTEDHIRFFERCGYTREFLVGPDPSLAKRRRQLTQSVTQPPRCHVTRSLGTVVSVSH